MQRIFSVALLFLLVACTAPGEIISAELAEPARGYSYGYRVYLPPCMSSESEFRYPTLYIIPGLGSGPDAWFASGLAKIADDLILSREMPPFIIVSTESPSGDPLSETIYNGLIPAIESQYPVMEARRYRAVAGGSLVELRHIVWHFNLPIHLPAWGYLVSAWSQGKRSRSSHGYRQ